VTHGAVRGADDRDDDTVAAWYDARAAAFAVDPERASRRADVLASARLVSFLVVLLCGAWLLSAPARAAIAAVALAASVALFLVLVMQHARARQQAARAQMLREINRRGAARVRRDWGALPAPAESLPANHAYATDLDVAASHASLYRLLDVVSSATGRPALMRWLLASPPSIEEIRERQVAVAELAPATALREELIVLARSGGEIAPEQFESFLQWAESNQPLTPGAWVVWAARIVPLVTISTVWLAFVRRLPWSVPGASLAAGLLLLAWQRTALQHGLTSALARATGLRAQRRTLEHLATTPTEAPILRRLGDRASGGADALRRLERTLALIEGQASLIHAAANAILLWDMHALDLLDRWRRRFGATVRDCLAALGEIEALAALGMLAHDNPRWALPVFDDSALRLSAADLGHPLIPAGTRVGNDVTIGPPGTLLVVTGSNMSGKSTLLRAVGLNVVLAQAGAPVCASRLTMPRLELRTSIHLADSLERGVSLFMAELERLKDIVEAARAPREGRTLLYLLDEILHGTNTAERLIAARAVLGHLVRAGAIGAVTTHDLTLAADGELAAASQLVHFTEQVTGTDGDGAPTMTFDYRLRPGLATSTNALKLLALVGLGGGEEVGARDR
jgi:hypothetical protein